MEKKQLTPEEKKSRKDYLRRKNEEEEFELEQWMQLQLFGEDDDNLPDRC